VTIRPGTRPTRRDHVGNVSNQLEITGRIDGSELHICALGNLFPLVTRESGDETKSELLFRIEKIEFSGDI
jgi:hypothetical protein